MGFNLRFFSKILCIFFAIIHIAKGEVNLLFKINKSIEITENQYIYEDQSPRINIDSIFKFDQFYRSNTAIANIGWSNARGWLRFELYSVFDQAVIIQIENPIFSELQFFVFENGILIQSENGLESGRLPELKTTIKANKKYSIFVAAKALLNPVKFPIRIINQEYYAILEAQERSKNGFLLGFLSVLILLNALAAYFFKIRAFALLALNAFFFTVLYQYLNGYLYSFMGRGVFDLAWLNIGYCIYFAYLFISLVFPWSLFKMKLLQYNYLKNSYLILIVWAVLHAIIYLFCSQWLASFSEKTIEKISALLRITALINQIFVLLIVAKAYKKAQLAPWFLLAIIPPMLSFTLPRFLPKALSGLWLTQSDLIEWALVWYLVVLTIGFMIYLSKNFEVKNTSEKVEILPAIQVETKIETDILKISHNLLSKREMEILQAYSNGFGYQEISDAFFISPHTVRTHIKNIYQKLGINSKAEAVRWVLEQRMT